MPEIPSQSNATMRIAASGLRAQQSRMRIIAENLANANSTARTAGGDPYRRQVPVFEPRAVDGGEGVSMSRVQPDQAAFRSTYDPGHPAADEKGNVKMPNVELLVETADMRDATRAYEANLQIVKQARELVSMTLDLLRVG